VQTAVGHVCVRVRVRVCVRVSVCVCVCVCVCVSGPLMSNTNILFSMSLVVFCVLLLGVWIFGPTSWFMQPQKTLLPHA
jgi:hypothetical protein